MSDMSYKNFHQKITNDKWLLFCEAKRMRYLYSYFFAKKSKRCD